MLVSPVSRLLYTLKPYALPIFGVIAGIVATCLLAHFQTGTLPAVKKLNLLFCANIPVASLIAAGAIYLDRQEPEKLDEHEFETSVEKRKNAGTIRVTILAIATLLALDALFALVISGAPITERAVSGAIGLTFGALTLCSLMDHPNATSILALSMLALLILEFTILNLVYSYIPADRNVTTMVGSFSAFLAAALAYRQYKDKVPS